MELTPRVHDFTPVFLEFWANNRSRGLDDQISHFKAEVGAAFPAFYDFKIEKWRRQGKDPGQEIGKELGAFPSIESRFATKARVISSEIASALKSFRSTFDDFRTDFDIYVVHSLGEMDGGARRINGELVFIFGVDGIVKYHHGQSDVPFYHHELFHFYHSQHAFSGGSLWRALWGEGLATLVSDELNPGATPQDMMLDMPVGLVAACEGRLPELWSEMRRDLLSESEDVYEKWFLLSSTDRVVPRRAGYYLGYLIAKELRADRSLKELARLQGPELLSLIESATDRLRTKP